MTDAEPLSGAFAELGAKAARLRACARHSFVAGLCLTGVAIFIWWPDPAGRELIGEYVSVPSPLDRLLIAEGAGIRAQPMGLLENGLASIRRLGLAIPVFLAGHFLLGRFVRSILLRTFAYLLSPYWVIWPLAVVGSAQGADGHANAARTGIVVERAGAPPAKADGSTRSPAVPAYHLRPEELSAELADQGRYVLAQQAYIDNDPGRAAGHLQRLRGSWQPAEARDRERIGVLEQWAAAHGHDPGQVARQLSDGRPHSTLRRLAALLVVMLAGLLCAGAAVLDVTGTIRKRRCSYLAARAASAPTLDSTAMKPVRPDFGRRLVRADLLS